MKITIFPVSMPPDPLAVSCFTALAFVKVVKNPLDPPLARNMSYFSKIIRHFSPFPLSSVTSYYVTSSHNIYALDSSQLKMPLLCCEVDIFVTNIIFRITGQVTITCVHAACTRLLNSDFYRDHCGYKFLNVVIKESRHAMFFCCLNA